MPVSRNQCGDRHVAQISKFGSIWGGNTLTIVGHNLADLSAENFDFSNSPPSQAVKDLGGFDQEPAAFEEDASAYSGIYDIDYGFIA